MVGVETRREVNKDDFEENREYVEPVQSSDGVAAAMVEVNSMVRVTRKNILERVLR